MDRKGKFTNEERENTFKKLEDVHEDLSAAFKKEFNRSLPFTDEVFDRWERAKNLGWGKDTSIYDSSYVFGDVEVGEKCWIGPFTIIDGSGGLKIGNSVTISAGVHIYTHENIFQTLSGGETDISRAPVSLGDCTYIGPQSIITMNVKIGKHCLIAANSMVKDDFEDFSIIAGNPAKKIGHVEIIDGKIELKYF